MFGNFFSSLVREPNEPDKSSKKQQQPTADLFAQLTQGSTQNHESGSSLTNEDPFAFFCSPDRSSTVRPNVSLKKPAISVSEAQDEDTMDGSQMPKLSLFNQNRVVDQVAQPVTRKKSNENMWDADDSDLSDSDEKEQEVVAAAAPSGSRKRDVFASIVQKAGTFIKQGTTSVKNTLSEQDQQSVVQVLTQENKQLRDVLQRQQQKVSDLEDEIEVHKSLEEEAHERNEELLYKVKYLEELARQNGNDLSSLRRVEELTLEKKSLQQQVSALERQMRLLENFKLGKDNPPDSEEEEREMFENPKRTLHDLKSLFEHHKIQFSKTDEARVLTAIYTQDRPVLRLYRELFFRRIAQKAIQSAENLFKQTNSADRNGNEMCKLALQNKRLLAQNEALKRQLEEAKQVEKQSAERQQAERVQWRHKLGKVQDKAKELVGQVKELRKLHLVLSKQVRQTQASLDDDEVLCLSEQKFGAYLGYFLEQQSQKQAQLSRQLEEQRRLTLKEKKNLEEQLVHNRETFEQLCHVQSERANIQEEFGEAQEMISHLQQEISRVQNELEQEKVASQISQDMLQQELSILKQQPQGSPGSGIPIETNGPSIEVQSEAISSKAAQQISELEKMLEEREEEILELMQEVNKLQLKKPQSPEEVDTLQILKSKLRNSQQRFHGDYQSQLKAYPPQAPKEIAREVSQKVEPSQQTLEDSKLMQHKPILIVDESGELSSQGSQRRDSSADVPHNSQQTQANFNKDVRAKLEEVQQQRLEQRYPSPDVRETFSRIVHSDKESNFFNSMVIDNNSGEKPAKKLDDLFGFLLQPTPTAQQMKEDNPNLVADNWSDAFGFPNLSQTSSKQQLPLAFASLQPLQKAKSHKQQPGWNEEADEDFNLEEERDEGLDKKPSKKSAANNKNVQISLDLDTLKDQLGEIMLQESLENSPIKRGSLVQNQSRDSDANDLQQPAQEGHSNEEDPIFEAEKSYQQLSLPQKSEDQASPTKVHSKQGIENSERATDSHHKRTKMLPLHNSIESKQRSFSEDDQMQPSYEAAIQSFQNEDLRQKDIDIDIYERLMEGEDGDELVQSESDSMLHHSPFDNSFTRQETDMVMAAITRERLNSMDYVQNVGASQQVFEEKKVNISNLSDLVPEDPIPERVIDATDDYYTRMIRPGELNEVVEELEDDYSDDQVCSPRQKPLGCVNHLRSDSVQIVDVETSHRSRKASMEYQQQKTHRYSEPPSMNESSKFLQMSIDQKESSEEEREQPPETSDEDFGGESGKSKPQKLAINTEESPQVDIKQFVSARSHHRQGSHDENLFALDVTPACKTPQGQRYETLAQFTKENLIRYEADGETQSAGNQPTENTCDFGDNKDFVQEMQSISVDEDRPPDVRNVNGLAFFTRDFRVLKNATYGNPDPSHMLLKKFQEEHGLLECSDERLEELHEQNKQSFAEPPQPEPEESSYSIDPELMGMQKNNFQPLQNMSQRSINMEEAFLLQNISRESFENALRDSFQHASIVDEGRMLGLLASIVSYNQSIVEQDQALINKRQSNENSIEEMQNGEDSYPEVDVFIEQTSQVAADQQEGSLDVDQPQVEDDDARSLETVDIIPRSSDVSPAKVWRQNSLPDEGGRIGKVTTQSNQKESESANIDGGCDDPNVAAQGGAGWENDESLEEIESAEDMTDTRQTRSVKGNEQVSEALPANEAFANANLERSNTPRLAKEDRRKDTPYSLEFLLIGNNQQDGKAAEVKGWAEGSVEISDEADLPEMAEGAVQEECEASVDLSQTMQAEMGESEKFKCPNGHRMMIVDGMKHPLPAQECSAYCGMANRLNNNNWLRCRQCFYKVCHNCFHCTGGHEMQSVRVDDVAIALSEAACSSCGNQVSGVVWMCEQRAQALKQGSSDLDCSDDCLICQDCLGSGVSFSRNSVSNVQMSEHDEEEKNTSCTPSLQAQNELKGEGFEAAQKEIPSFEELFFKAETQKKAQAVADPFQMLLAGVQTSVTSSAEKEMAASTEVGGTGGGWDDDEEDIEIE